MTGESISQLMLQSSILIFQLIHHEGGEGRVYLSEKTFECVSILTSLTTVHIGLSTHWVAKYKKDAKITEKLGLFCSNMPDICLRLALVLGASIYSMQWMYGLVTVNISCLIFLWLFPVVIRMVNGCRCKDENHVVADRSLVLAPMPWQVTASKERSQNSRICNKIVGLCIAVFVTAFEVTSFYGLIPLPQQDSW